MPTTDDIIAEAKERFRRCQTWESTARNNWKADVRFGMGDAINLFQWQGDAIDSRNAAGKPCFTINRTRNYCMQIINEAKQNKAQVEVRPVGNGASFQAAEIIEGIVRHIEYISNAEEAYEKATFDQVFGGIGYWRIVTDYADDDSFDQEIFIRRVPDALSVYLDPYIQQFDGSDAKFAFVFDDMDKDQFKKSYPRYANAISDLPFAIETHDDLWLREDRVRIAEYYRKRMVKDVLHNMPDGTTVRESDVEDKALLDMVRQSSQRKREIERPQVEWYLIVGDRVVEQSIWPGKYIPIVRVVGIETVIDGQLDRCGHVRNLLDSQKSLNYYISAGIEYVAAQTKSPFIADVKSIEGVEEYWRDANLKNYSVLPYNGRSDDGQEIAPPHRADPPVYAAAFLDGMKVSVEEMEMVSGQPPAALGEPSNERSGKSILERQRAAANSTYHFVNNLSNAIRFTGKILIDLITGGVVYDTPRIMKILAQDGALQTVQLDPNAQQAHQPMQALDQESFDPQQIAAVINPTIGAYDVVAEIGPQYTTRRQEFVNATMDILAQNESLTPLIGDLVFRNMDFPGAVEIADRMRRNLAATNPAAVGNQDPQVVMLQQQLAQQHQIMQQMAQELQQSKMKQESIAFQKDIDYYKAQSDRIKAVGGIDPQALKPVIRSMVSEILGVPVNAVIGAHLAEDALMTQHAANQAAQLAQTDVQPNPNHPPMPAPQPAPPAAGAANG